MKEYSIKQVKTIDCNKIIFTDGFEIVFEDCINEWNGFYNCNSKCIAERNILSNAPYFLFFTKERTKIIFNCGLFKRTRKKAFQRFKNTIIQYGYTTYDLS